MDKIEFAKIFNTKEHGQILVRIENTAISFTVLLQNPRRFGIIFRDVPDGTAFNDVVIAFNEIDEECAVSQAKKMIDSLQNFRYN